MNRSPDNTLMEFHSDDGRIKLSVRLDVKDDTVWLNLNQIAQLFQRDKSVISRHLKKIIKSGELNRDSVVAFFATTAADGKTYDVEFFNLDAILAVGYRVNSKKGTEFRRWASQVLKDYLTKGFSLNKDKLLNSGMNDLARSLDLLKQSLLTHDHVTDIGSAAIDIIRSYAKSWLLLNAFDEDRLGYPQKHTNHEIRLTTEMAEKGVIRLKSTLIDQDEASPLFGVEQKDAFKQIMGSIHQTFSGEMLYPSVYERAAHLFYFTIKDHPFIDGNKRIGSFLLLLYLSFYDVEISLSNEALIALALFVAQSKPSDKDIMIRLILNLIVKEYYAIPSRRRG